VDARVKLIEAAYRFDLGEPQQLDLIAQVMRRRYEPRKPLLVFTSHVIDGTVRYRAAAANDEIAPLFEVPVPAHDLERMHFTTPARHSLATLLSPAYHAGLASRGIGDFVGLNCPTHTGTALVLGTIQAEPHRVSDGERRYWRPVALHLAAGLRLREHVAAHVGAVFRVDRGRCETVELVGAARLPSARDALRHAVLQRERARSARGAADGELWRALVDGRWTLIDRFEEGGRRYLLGVHNPPATPLPVLDARERQVIDAVVRGDSNKAIAIDLGLSEATISRTLRAALGKLGVGLADLLAVSRTNATALQLARTRLGLVAVSSDPERMRELSSGERAAVAGVLRGLPTAAVARARQVTTRTVINQLASAYQKLGVRSRRELILALAR
jgi:DNA-binding NarL/FixJ family response regulator